MLLINIMVSNRNSVFIEMNVFFFILIFCIFYFLTRQIAKTRLFMSTHRMHQTFYVSLSLAIYIISMFYKGHVGQHWSLCDMSSFAIRVILAYLLGHKGFFYRITNELLKKKKTFKKCIYLLEIQVIVIIKDYFLTLPPLTPNLKHATLTFPSIIFTVCFSNTSFIKLGIYTKYYCLCDHFSGLSAHSLFDTVCCVTTLFFKSVNTYCYRKQAILMCRLHHVPL